MRSILLKYQNVYKTFCNIPVKKIKNIGYKENLINLYPCVYIMHETQPRYFQIYTYNLVQGSQTFFLVGQNRKLLQNYGSKLLRNA